MEKTEAGPIRCHMHILFFCIFCFFITLNAVALDSREFKHKRNFKNTMVLMRGDYGYAYEICDNYNKRFWLDRPLFMNTGLRRLPADKAFSESFNTDLNILKKYGDNVLYAPLYVPRNNYKIRFDRMLKSLEKTGNKNNKIVIILEFPPKNEIQKNMIKELISQALKSDYVFKVDDKLFIIVYHADHYYSLAKYKEYIQELKKDFPGKLIFISDLVYPFDKETLARLYNMYYKNNRKIPSEYIDKFKEKLAAYLDISDGILFAHVQNNLQAPSFESRFDKAAYEYVIRILDDVLSKKEYRNKYLGLKCSTGYNNPGIPYIIQEDGTKRFRNSIEASLKADPDFIFCTCWIEVNENDLFTPSVCDGLSKMRMMRYYTNRMQGKKPLPPKGDNTLIPDLVLSHRVVVTLGERIEIELLNIPDTEEIEPYTAQLLLKDINGTVIKVLPPVNFSTNKMEDKTFFLPSEEFKDYTVIQPEIRIDYKGREIAVNNGLQYIHIRPSWNWNYKFCNQPVRDILKPLNFLFKSGPDPETQGIIFEGLFECEKELASVEILENNFPVWAYDINNVYGNPAENIVLFVNYENSKPENISVNGKISLKNSDGYIQKTLMFYRGETYSLQPSNKKTVFIDEKVRPDRWYKHGVFVIVPKKDIKTARIICDLNILKTDISVKNACEKGVVRKKFGNDIFLTVEKYNKSPDIPVPIGKKKVIFSNIPHRTNYKNAVSQLRVISKDGKIFRSAPIVYNTDMENETVLYDVYSETAKKPLKLKFNKSRLPDINYGFNPDDQALLRAGCGASWDARMGGLGHYSPFIKYLYRFKKFPDDITDNTPQWVKIDGEPCLKFERGDYIVFPRNAFPGWKGEVLPRGSFTLIFEMMPTSDKPAVLFKQTGWHQGSLSLYLENGKLAGSFENNCNEKFLFPPELEIPMNKWSKVIVMYDLKQIQLIVNGIKSKPIPVNGKGIYFMSCVFGGYNKTSGISLDWFEGYLKSFRIVHRALAPEELMK